MILIMSDFLDPVPEFFPFKDYVSKIATEIEQKDKEKKDRRKTYNKAIQEQLEEESLQEGKIGQRFFGPIRSWEYRAAEFRKTRNEIRELPTADFCPDS